MTATNHLVMTAWRSDRGSDGDALFNAGSSPSATMD
jgi:hypothetical protein